MEQKQEKALFELGEVVATRRLAISSAQEEGLKDKIAEALNLHQRGDFGALTQGDKEENLRELQEGVLENGGGRILSRYHTNGQPNTDLEHYKGDIYIQTQNEGGLLYTCIMFVDEY